MHDLFPPVKKLAANGDTEGLAKLLRHHAWSIRCDAARTLDQLGDPRGVDYFLADLNSSSAPVRACAARDLGRLNDRRAVLSLMKACTDPAWEVRLAAVRALQSLEDTQAVPSLITASYDPDKEVRLAASQALQAFQRTSVSVPHDDTDKSTLDDNITPARDEPINNPPDVPTSQAESAPEPDRREVQPSPVPARTITSLDRRNPLIYLFCIFVVLSLLGRTNIYWIGVFLLACASGALCGLAPLSCATEPGQRRVGRLGFGMCVLAGLAGGLTLAVPTAIVCSGIVLYIQARARRGSRSSAEASTPVTTPSATTPSTPPIRSQPQRPKINPLAQPAAPPQAPSQSKGLFLQIIGGVIMLLCMSLLQRIWIYPGVVEIGVFTGSFLNIIAVIVFYYAVAMYNRGRQHRQKTASKVLLNDQRPPVLYLRSFYDDKVAAQTSSDPIHRMTYPFGATITAEEELVHVLRKTGPVIAIGKPREKLPELGAAREYVADDEWQHWIITTMGRASLVVVRIGMTKGLWWEVQRAVQLVSPDRLVFIVPWDEEVYTAFRIRFTQDLGRHLPEQPTTTIGPTSITSKNTLPRSIRGFIYFNADWTPHYSAPM